MVTIAYRNEVAMIPPTEQAPRKLSKLQVGQGILATTGLLLTGIAKYGEADGCLQKESAKKFRFAGHVTLALSAAPTIFGIVVNKDDLLARVASAIMHCEQS